MHPVVSLHLSSFQQNNAYENDQRACNGYASRQCHGRAAQVAVRHDNTGPSDVLTDPWLTTGDGFSSTAAVWTNMGVVRFGIAYCEGGMSGCAHAVYTSAALSRR
jgi:hypothetical protein